MKEMVRVDETFFKTNYTMVFSNYSCVANNEYSIEFL